MASSAVVTGLLALTFCVWAVSLGGLAAVQEDCNPDWTLAINGFTSTLPCYRIFRYYWWIISLEFVLICGLGIAIGAHAYGKTRTAFQGLFVVATVLYIQMTDTVTTLSNYTDSAEGQTEHRVNTWLAGAIMTSAINCLLVFALGMTEDEAAAATSQPTVSAEKTAAAV